MSSDSMSQQLAEVIAKVNIDLISGRYHFEPYFIELSQIEQLGEDVSPHLASIRDGDFLKLYVVFKERNQSFVFLNKAAVARELFILGALEQSWGDTIKRDSAQDDQKKRLKTFRDCCLHPGVASFLESDPDFFIRFDRKVITELAKRNGVHGAYRPLQDPTSELSGVIAEVNTSIMQALLASVPLQYQSKT
jgi:hypothetical protein